MSLSIDDFKKIRIPVEFGLDETEDTDGLTYEIEQVVSQLKKMHPADHFIWCFGMSKFVVLLDNLVVKIPFNGYFSYIPDPDTGEYPDELDFLKFDYSSDYCSIEESLYLKAAEAGLGNFFAATIQYGKTADGTPYYISEKVYTMYDDKATKLRKPSPKGQKKASKTHLSINKIWLACAIDRYGEKATNRFIKFLEDNGIEDLHSDNIGFRKNGDPVLLDYCSFYY